MAKNTTPYVALACICERVLQDKDSVMSLIRVVDTYYLTIPADAPKDATPAFEVAAVISLKSGDLVGSFNKLQIVGNNPGGERKAMTEKPIPTIFNGGAHGVNVQLNLTVVVKKFGMFWFDVLWGDEVLTRIPLDVKSGQQPVTR
jgi:hypothetical protein